MDELILGEHKFTSRLILGTGKFSDSVTMVAAIKASGARIVTVALRRINIKMPSDDLLAPLLKIKNLTIMPNTSGARDAREAVRPRLSVTEDSRKSCTSVGTNPTRPFSRSWGST